MNEMHFLLADFTPSLYEETPDFMEQGDFDRRTVIRVAASALYEIEGDDWEIEL